MRTHTLRPHLFLVFAALAALAACSGSTADIGNADSGTPDGGGPEAATTTPTQAATDVSAALCNKIDACSHTLMQLTYGSAASCATRLQPSVLSGLTASGSTLTTTQIEQCVTDLAGASCGDAFGHNLPASCQAPAGTIADGSACGSDDQCMNGRCKVAVNAVCGTCGSRAPAGGMCSVDNDCANTLRCAPNGICVKYGMAGDLCDANHGCRADFRCTGGTCALPVASGMPCKDPMGNDCDASQGFYCSNTTSTCTAVTLAGPGNACGVVNGAFVGCLGPGSFCKGFALPASPMGMCLAAAADGAACDTTNGPLCSTPAVCVNGTCKYPDATMCH